MKSNTELGSDGSNMLLLRVVFGAVTDVDVYDKTSNQYGML